MLAQLTQNVFNIPLAKFLLTVIIWVVILGFKQIIRNLILVRLGEITSKTQSKLDDELLKVIEPPIEWFIILAGIEITKLTLGQYLGVEFNSVLSKLINLSAVSIGAYIVYQVSPILGDALKQLTLRTETELDDIFVPYLPRIFQIGAVLIVILKASETLLGASATAILGLLGGAGLAFGLLIKDVIYDTCCTIIIYLDKIYRVGDLVVVPEIQGFARVQEIGLRSTTLCVNKNNSYKKIPNSKMINGIVENWSQHPGENNAYGINITLKIDNISAKQTARIYEGLGDIPKLVSGLSDRHLVKIDGLEQNARVFTLRVFCEDWSNYFVAQSALTIAILEFLEKEQIDYLNVALNADIPQLVRT